MMLRLLATFGLFKSSWAAPTNITSGFNISPKTSDYTSSWAPPADIVSEFNVSANAFDYANEKIKGVNVGGWLLLEPWITPSLFDYSESYSSPPADEYTLCETLGSNCYSYLKNHWDTFITETDFADMKNTYGLNFVRIPIGYWAYKLLPGDAFTQGQDEYLEKAIQWAQKYDLKVWIDLHGLPGSQNGFDNSGRVGQIGFFYNQQYEELAVEVLEIITAKYLPQYQDTVIGIELVNEPFGPSIPLDKLEEYYKDGYEAVRKHSSDVPVVLHDGFIADTSWMAQYVPQNGFTDTIFDFHHYVVFTNDLYGKPISDVISTVCTWGAIGNSQPRPVVVGEWSAALTDCAKYLNGVGNSLLRYEQFNGAGSCANKNNIEAYDQTGLDNLSKYIEAQLDAYSYGNGAGWVFWNYKTESSLEWDFKRLVDNSIFPAPPYTERKFPNQCGY